VKALACLRFFPSITLGVNQLHADRILANHRFQWREPGFKGPRTKDLGRCSDMNRAEARSAADAILQQLQGVTAPILPPRYRSRASLKIPTSTSKRANGKPPPEARPSNSFETTSPFGKQLLHSITRKELQAHLDRLAKDDKSESVVDHVHWQMAAIFRMAKSDGLIAVDPIEALGAC
jgi:hypothetical protein